MKNVIITEHTTTDDPYCNVVNADNPTQFGDYFGSIEDFREQYPDIAIVEEVWS
jgi:hypothetical protein